MSLHVAIRASLSAVVVGALFAPLAHAQPVTNPSPSPMAQPMPSGSQPASSSAKPGLDRLLDSWSPEPRLAARQLIAEYGPPQSVSKDAIVWREVGPFARVKVSRELIPHDFPMPHQDFVEHTVAYDVPTSKIDDLVAFDSSLLVDKTAGQLSARGDSELHNVLALNLANEVITGKKDVAAARRSLAQLSIAELEGERSPYVAKLQFEPQPRGSAFVDQPAPGAPQRADVLTQRGQEPAAESEAAALLLAIDKNEVKAAQVASKKNVSPAVLELAQQMRTDHGRDIADTLAITSQNRIVPIDTNAVEQMQLRGASELASLLPLEGKAFEVAYVDAMIIGHLEAQQVLDQQIIPSAATPELKQRFIDARDTVTQHLAHARRVRATLDGRVSLR